MRAKEKKSNIINLPIILFIVIFINYLPLVIKNATTRESFGVGNMQMLACFIIEIIILLIYFIVTFIKNGKKINLSKDIKLNLILLFITTVVLFGVQAYNFAIGELEFMDILNIGCIFLNIFLLYICMINIQTNEKNIYSFFKCIIYFTLIACIVNLFLYYKDIYELLFKGKYKWDVMIKSFFANRNQFAFFLYLGIISDFFVMKQDKNIIYKIILLIFGVSLFSTGSRTGIALGVILLGIMFLVNNKIRLRTKIIIALVAITLLIIGITAIYNFKPDIWKKISTNFIRIGEVKNLSGRTDIWKAGTELIKESPQNLFVGVGRFKAIETLENIKGRTFTQFHNIYIDSLTTGGIMELLYFGFIYFSVIRNIIKSNLDRKYVSIYIAMFITYAIYISLESFGRFSIGASDTICFIFFITIPLLHANSIKNKEQEINEK